MSLVHYLLLVFLGFCFFFLAIIWLLGGPQAALGSEAMHMWWKIPLGAAAMTGMISKWAAKTPRDERLSLRSYRDSNFMLLCLAGATFIALLVL